MWFSRKKRFLVKTKDGKSRRLTSYRYNGFFKEWMVHRSLVVKAKNIEEAKAVFETRFPNNVFTVYEAH